MEKLSLKLIRSPARLIEDFCKDCKLRGMTNESIRRYKSSLQIFAHFLLNTGINLNHVNQYVLRDFLHFIKYERKVKHKTVENYFSALSAFYDYLIFEGLTSTNHVLPFRKRYLRRYKDSYDDPERKLLSVEEMSRLVNSIIDPRDKAIAVLFAKTGIRRSELLRIDVSDIKWEDYSITLKPAPKRSNRIVFFDDECAFRISRAKLSSLRAKIITAINIAKTVPEILATAKSNCTATSGFIHINSFLLSIVPKYKVNYN